MTHSDVDLRPDCNHQWVYDGLSTICEPEVAHYACPHCRTWKHVTLHSRYNNDPRDPPGTLPKEDEAHYSDVWLFGVWTEEHWQEIMACALQNGRPDATT